MSRKLMFAILVALPLTGASLCAAAQDTTATATPGGRPSFFQHRLKAMDANGDSRISLDEYLAAATKRFQSIDTQNKGSVTAADIAASPQMQRHEQRMAQRMLRHMGASPGSDSVTLDQFLAAAKTRFAKLDANGDGFIDASEATGHRWAHTQAPPDSN